MNHAPAKKQHRRRRRHQPAAQPASQPQSTCISQFSTASLILFIFESSLTSSSSIQDLFQPTISHSIPCCHSIEGHPNCFQLIFFPAVIAKGTQTELFQDGSFRLISSDHFMDVCSTMSSIPNVS